MDAWAITHDYRRLVQRGNLAGVFCKTCRLDMWVTVVDDTEPAWYCGDCKNTWKPGGYSLDQMYAMTLGKEDNTPFYV